MTEIEFISVMSKPKSEKGKRGIVRTSSDSEDFRSPTIFIDCLNPGNTISPNILMNLEKGIEIASCWKEFNPPKLRNYFLRKFHEEN